LIYNTVSYFIFRALGTLFEDLNIADHPLPRDHGTVDVADSCFYVSAWYGLSL